jgi:PAS domain S-box-containing protein
MTRAVKGGRQREGIAVETEAVERGSRPAGDWYQAIFEAHPDAMVIYDRASGDILKTNGRMCHLFGYSPEETRRLKVTDLGAPEATGEMAFPWQLADDSGAGAAARQVWQARDRAGRQFWVEAHLQAVPRDGRAQALAVIREMNQPQPEAAALEEKEALYRLAMEGSLAGVYVIGEEGFIYVNPTLAQIFGYRPEEISGRLVKPHELVHPDDLALVREKIRRRLSGELVAAHYTFRGVRQDGTVIFCESFGRPVEYQGRPVVVGTLLDITAPQQAQEALRRSEARYRAIVEDQTELVTRFRPDGTLTFVNEAACRYFGKSPEELLGKDFLPFIPGEDRAIIQKIFSLTPENPIVTLEHRVLAPDGEVGWQQWTNRAIFDGQGNLQEYQAVGRDITPRKQAEALQRQALEELEHRVEERTVWLRRANSQLLQEIEERKRAEEMLRLQRDLSLVLSSRVGMQETLRLCVEAALSISGMDSGGVYLVNRASGSLDLAFSQGVSPEFAARVQHYEADSVNAHLVMAGEPIYARIRDLPGILDEGALIEGLRSVAIIPVHHKDEIIAVINVASRTHEEVPETARVTLETIASQVGSAIARVQAEEALRASEERFRAFMDHLPGIAFMMDARDRLVYLNQNLENLLRQSFNVKLTADFLGKTNGELWPPEVAQKFHADGRRVLIRRESLQFIETFRQADGLHHWLVHKFPILGQEGSPELVGGIAIDITELKEAEEALRRAKEGLERRVAQRTAQLKEANQALQLELRERRKMEESLRQSEARYRTLVEQIPAITYMIALEEKINLLYISPQIESILGFTPDEWRADPEMMRPGWCRTGRGNPAFCRDWPWTSANARKPKRRCGPPPKPCRR